MTVMPKVRRSIAQYYINNPSTAQEEVGNIFGVGKDTVLKILREFGIKPRIYSGERSMASRSSFFDFEFFERYDKVTAYWAGFFMADGSVNFGSTGGARLVCYIHPKDSNHMIRAYRDLGIQAPLKTRKDGTVGFELNYSKFREQLPRWGIVPRKTKNFYPPNIPPNLLSHYIRGWIDGDGSVYRYGRQSRVVVASGNKLSLLWLSNAIREIGYTGHIGVRPLRKRFTNNYTLYIGGALQVATVCELLLVDSEYCLDRKWQGTRRDR